MTTIYYVRACPNCRNFNKKERTCDAGHNNRLEEWFEEFGRYPMRKWTEEMDIIGSCYEESEKIAQMNKRNADIDDFLNSIPQFKEKYERNENIQ